jgi:hypothetical protein
MVSSRSSNAVVDGEPSREIDGRSSSATTTKKAVALPEKTKVRHSLCCPKAHMAGWQIEMDVRRGNKREL